MRPFAEHVPDHAVDGVVRSRRPTDSARPSVAGRKRAGADGGRSGAGRSVSGQKRARAAIPSGGHSAGTSPRATR